MTSVVGDQVGPTNKPKNCDTWAEYEPPMKSAFANLCNGGSFEEHRWQPCPSRLHCRAATQEAKKGHLQVLSPNRSGYNTPTRTGSQAPATTRVITPNEGSPHLDTPRLAPKPEHRPSPTFLPKKNESLLLRFVKNVVQGMIHALFHQGKELAENTDFFPEQEAPEE